VLNKDSDIRPTHNPDNGYTDSIMVIWLE
jgi:hypothetical protein